MTNSITSSLPSVSVAMPVYNSARFVAESLDSILAQTYPPLEIIVVDDSSNDGSSEIIARYTDRGVRHILREREQGIFSAFNRAVTEAQGDLIAFISSDDLWLPEKLETQAAVMARNPELEYVTTYFMHFLDEQYPPKPEHVRSTHTAQLQRGNLLETVMARKGLFNRHGGFAEEFQISADVDWLARMVGRHVPTACVEQILVKKRLHADNANTRDVTLTQSELLRIMHRAARDRIQGLGQSRNE